MRPIFVKLMSVATVAVLTATAGAQSFPWTTLSPTTSPSARERAGSATDGSVIYLYGGQVGTSTAPYADLLSFDGTDWTQLTASGAGAGPRSSPVMAWDSARGRLVVFGGKGDAASWNNRLQDTWEWDAVNGWVQKSPATVPDKRWLLNGVYVPGFGVVFHGGNAEDSIGTVYTDNQTWAYDGVDWSVIATGPTRQNGTLTYRAGQNDLILFGGTAGSGNLSETWRLDLTGTPTWSQILTTTQPTSDNATGGPGLVGTTGYYNEVTSNLIIHGGQGNGGAPSRLTWEFDGIDWTDISWPGAPNIRNAPGQWLVATQRGYALCGNSSNTARDWTQQHEWCPGTISPYGTGCPGTGGIVPTLAIDGCPIPGSNVTILIADGLGGSSAFLLFGLGQGNTPIGGGCSLLLGSVIGPTLSIPLGGVGAGNGSTQFGGLLPAGTSGLTITFQAFVIDGASSVGGSATNGVQMDIG